MEIPEDNESHTYADFLEWEEDFLTELLDGKIVKKVSPSIQHQRLVGELLFQIGTFLKDKKCKVYPSIGVRLFPREDKRDNTVFIPDIVVICDTAKLDYNGCNGPPELVIEVCSPSSARYDRLLKFRKYQKAGVREYWIVDPEIKTVQVCILENGRYITSVYDETDKAPVSVLEGCEIDLAEVFAE